MKKLKDTGSRGMFIVLYASNNLGKSEQIKRLASRFITEGKQVLVIKYPIYNLEPTGPFINKVLRHPEELDREIKEDEFQTYYAQNRRDFQNTLINVLNAGINVIAEDYTGTGIAWGMTRDVKLEDLEEMNAGLLTPDIEILLDGNRFITGVEKQHRNEGAGEDIWTKNRKIHLLLAERYGWKVVHANQDIDIVSKDINRIIDNYEDYLAHEQSICALNED
jgi:thymidylate kinase